MPPASYPPVEEHTREQHAIQQADQAEGQTIIIHSKYVRENISCA